MSDQTSVTQAASALSELISSFQPTSITDDKQKSKAAGQNNSTLPPLPTPLQFYQIGLVLQDLSTQQRNGVEMVMKKYQELMVQIPLTYLKQVVFRDLNRAFISVVSGTSDQTQVTPAVNSLCGLYTNSSVACQAGYSKEICLAIASYHDKVISKQHRHSTQGLLNILLRILAALLVDGLIAGSNTQESESNSDNAEESHLEQVMEVVRALTINEKSACLGDLQEWQQLQQDVSGTLQEAIQTRFDATPQREYLLKMLTSCPRTSDTKPAKATSTKTKEKDSSFTSRAPGSDSISEIQRRIQQVQDVLPDLGEGYVETALSCYQGDVSRTLAALLEGEADPASLHPTLQVMDKTLPARRKETPESTLYQLNDDEAKRITKTRLAEMEQRQEEEAYALTAVTTTKDEYNDDYDDQYDGLDGTTGTTTGGADVGMYDYDINTVKTYNRIARQAEEEGSFWEENKNTNRQAGGAAKKGKYRGPDKGKGGRIIGPDGKYLPHAKGGKKGRQQQAKNANSSNAGTPSTTQNEGSMTKLQQRRKNNNKSKLANHRRKERAQKKAMGGM